MADEINLNEEEYEPVVVDLDGEQFEIIDTVEVDGRSYAALTPYTEEDELEEEEIEFIILEICDDGEGDECTLKTVDDEELYTKIGDEFGRRDHSTIMSSCRKIEQRLENDIPLKMAIAEIEKILLQ